MQVTIDKGMLVVSIPMDKEPRLSTSGKSLVVASSRGNQVSPLEIDGQALIVSVNAYVRA